MISESQKRWPFVEFEATTLLLVNGFSDLCATVNTACDRHNLVRLDQLLRDPACLTELLSSAALAEISLADEYWGNQWHGSGNGSGIGSVPIDIHLWMDTALKSLTARGLVRAAPPEDGGGHRITDLGRLAAHTVASDSTWGPVWWRIGFMGRHLEATRRALWRTRHGDDRGKSRTTDPGLGHKLERRESVVEIMPDAGASSAVLPPRLDAAREDLAMIWRSCSPRQRRVFEARNLGPSRRSYRKIGVDLGVTSEAIRRMVDRLSREMEQGSEAAQGWAAIAAEALRREAGPIVSLHAIERLMATLLPSGAPHSGEPAVEFVLRRMLDERAGYTSLGETCMDRPTRAVVDLMVKCAQAIADEVGLVDENALRSCLPNAEWQQHWDVLVSLCGLARLPSGLALRHTKRARIKASLTTIGHPATKAEVAEACGPPNIKMSIVGNCLSSEASVIRTGKTKWALREWGHREYTGVSSEITRMIQESGGSIDVDTLIRYLPAMFGVAPTSVTSHLSLARFSVQEGRATLADLSQIPLRPLEEVTDGHTDDGNPYWRFRVEDRFLSGYSLTRVPPELVSALGCRPTERVRAPVRYPAECQPISAGWMVDAVGGCDVGRLADALKRLGARGGDEALLVINEDRSVSFRLAPRSRDVSERSAAA